MSRSLTNPSRGAPPLTATTERAADGSMSYEIKKPPKPAKNYLDILYLDEELRITRGSKGSVVIAERARDAVAA